VIPFFLVLCSCQGVSDKIQVGNGCFIRISGDFHKKIVGEETYYYDDDGSKVSFQKKEGDIFSKQVPWGSIEVEERIFNGVSYKHAIHTMSRLNKREDIYFVRVAGGHVLLTGPVVKDGLAGVIVCE